MIHLSRFVSADSVLPIRLYRFSSIDSVLLIYFCRFTYINLLMLICFTQFTSADSHSYNAMLSTLCFHLCRGYITAFCNRYRIPFDFISRNSMRQTPGRRNSRRFPDAHTGRLDAHGRLQDKAGADTASRHDQVFDFLRYQRAVRNFIESALGQLLRNLLPVGVNKPGRTADRIRKTTLVMVVIFHQIMPAANPPGFFRP